MAEVREEDIYNEVLIYEVQLRPALYDKSLKEYGDSGAKAKLWEEVATKVYSTVWHKLPPDQKLLAGKLLKRRWRNIRTAFMRDLHREQAEKLQPGTKRRRKYIYFNEISFLIPFLQMKEPSENSDAQVKEVLRRSKTNCRNLTTGTETKDPGENSNPQVNEVPIQSKTNRRNPTTGTEMKEPSENSDVQVNEVPRPSRTNSRNLTTESEMKGGELEMLLHAKSIGHEEPELVSKPSVHSPENKKRRRQEEYQPDILPERNRTDFDASDSAKHFTLSLVPLLKALAPHQKLDAQIQILQIFRNFHNESLP